MVREAIYTVAALAPFAVGFATKDPDKRFMTLRSVAVAEAVALLAYEIATHHNKQQRGQGRPMSGSQIETSVSGHCRWEGKEQRAGDAAVTDATRHARTSAAYPRAGAACSVTPEWMAENAEKQAAYEQRRRAWIAKCYGRNEANTAASESPAQTPGSSEPDTPGRSLALVSKTLLRASNSEFEPFS